MLMLMLLFLASLLSLFRRMGRWRRAVTDAVLSQSRPEDRGGTHTCLVSPCARALVADTGALGSEAVPPPETRRVATSPGGKGRPRRRRRG